MVAGAQHFMYAVSSFAYHRGTANISNQDRDVLRINVMAGSPCYSKQKMLGRGCWYLKKQACLIKQMHINFPVQNNNQNRKKALKAQHR